MDGVIVNFVGGVCRLFGVSELDLDFNKYGYNISQALLEVGAMDLSGADLEYLESLMGTGDKDAIGALCANHMWKRINQSEEDGGFWDKLESFPWTMKLYNKLNELAPVVLLTSPSWSTRAPSQKVKWIKRHFGRHTKRIITAEKHWCAAPGRVLVDDAKHNIRKWKEWGGTGILFKRPTNTPWEDLPRPEQVVDLTYAEVKSALDQSNPRV